jgi:hypothetical protein
MPTVQNLNQAIADIRNTVSGKVEYHTGGASLLTVVNDIADLIHKRGVATAASIIELEAYSNTETNFVAIWGVGASNGLYSYRATGTPNYTTSFPATGGGIWRLVTLD